jgi:phage I-like protein
VTNPAAAETTDTDQVASRTTRRAVLGLGAFGVAMAAARTASAAAGTDPSELAEFAMSAELTARDLYQLADGDLWSLMASHHSAYAERIAGIAGLSARGRNDAIFDSLSDAFSSGDPSDAALELENTLAATHTELLGMIDSRRIVAAIASIATTESRHAATIAATSGADLDTQLTNSAAALAPEA